MQAGYTTILILSELDVTSSQRAIDWLNGLTQFINGDSQWLGEDIFLFTPDSVKIQGGKKPHYYSHCCPIQRIQQSNINLGDGVTLEMIPIPGGNFEMGSPATEKQRSNNEGPIHSVTVAPFYMSKHPITQCQWQAIAKLYPLKQELDPNPSCFQGDRLPVEKVSWYDAVEFCQRLSLLTNSKYRLPSEAEWEYTCRGGTTTPFYVGTTITTESANYDGHSLYEDEDEGCYREKTTPVGGLGLPNKFGLYDLHGNVWEWCADYWHEDYQNAPTDGSV